MVCAVCLSIFLFDICLLRCEICEMNIWPPVLHESLMSSSFQWITSRIRIDMECFRIRSKPGLNCRYISATYLIYCVNGNTSIISHNVIIKGQAAIVDEHPCRLESCRHSSSCWITLHCDIVTATWEELTMINFGTTLSRRHFKCISLSVKIAFQVICS